MRMYDVIKNKRDGKELTTEEINFFVSGYVDGTIPDYQASALCMAIYFKGMSLKETTDLTFAIRDSGEKLDFSAIKGTRVDKHSTGGVGDKTSLVVAPIVASLGVKVAKMSGRGLGHTGGTIDKLESIPGFNATLSQSDFERIVNDIGIAITGQSGELAPADKLLYALRDVTATVDSMPLIASSIMGKKLAADDDCIVLDVKTGSGSFMKTQEESKELAKIMVGIGKQAGKKMLALVTNMDTPLGNAIGNSLEVIEAVETLKGEGPEDFTEVCVTLATDMLYLAGKGTREECESAVKGSIKNGTALETFAKMVKAQGGYVDCVYDTDKLPKAKFCYEVKSDREGYIHHVDTEGYGISSLLLGAGRNTKEDKIDYSAGIILKAKTGDRVKKGDVIAKLYANDKNLFVLAEKKFIDSTEILSDAPIKGPLIISRIV